MNPTTLFGISWNQPSYYTFTAGNVVSTYTLFDMAYEQQWRKVQNQIGQYALYQSNWDGMGSVVARADALEVATKLLNRAKSNSNVAPSAATLTPNGSIQIEWWFGDNVLQAEIENRNRIEWVEFGPNRAPKHWSERIYLGNPARGANWEATQSTDERAVASASET